MGFFPITFIVHNQKSIGAGLWGAHGVNGGGGYVHTRSPIVTPLYVTWNVSEEHLTCREHGKIFKAKRQVRRAAAAIALGAVIKFELSAGPYPDQNPGG